MIRREVGIRIDQLRVAIRPWWMQVPLLLLGVLGALVFGGFRINTSGSLPLGIYRVISHVAAVERGAYVIVCLPKSWSRFAVKRQILSSGNCPGGSVGLGKVVAAVEGDVVTITREGLVVGTAHLRNGQVLDRDRFGREIPHFPWGRYTIRQGELWLYSCHPAAFDSRYFGPARDEWLTSMVKPVLTERGWSRRSC